MTKRQFPQKKDNPRNEIIPVAVTKQEKDALRTEAERRDTSVSALAYDMMRRGSLESLVAIFVANDSQ